MKRRSSFQQRAITGRRGSITVWTVFVMISCICCVSLVANTSYLSVLRSDSRHCAQVAALAAGRQLLKDDILRRNQRGFEVAGWRANAKSAALDIGQAYVSGHAVPELKPQDIEIEMGSMVDVQIGSVLPVDFLSTRILVSVANYDRNRPSGNFLLSGLTGITKGKISEHSEVILKNRVVGFRPDRRTATPIMPLALPDDSISRTSDCWSTEIEAGQGRDRLRWDSALNAVRSGPDRLPEIVLTVNSGDMTGGPGIAQVVSWSTRTPVRDVLVQFSTGLRPEHLSTSSNGMLIFPSAAGGLSIDATEIRKLRKELRPLVGQVRIFPLYDATARQLSEPAGAEEDSQNDTNVGDHQLLRSVTARILRLEIVSDQQLRIVLQPAVLSTPTAVIATANDSTSHNRYVWKICVVR